MFHYSALLVSYLLDQFTENARKYKRKRLITNFGEEISHNTLHLCFFNSPNVECGFCPSPPQPSDPRDPALTALINKWNSRRTLENMLPSENLAISFHSRSKFQGVKMLQNSHPKLCFETKEALIANSSWTPWL